MKSRYIGEKTRFVYDIMPYTESDHIPGAGFIKQSYDKYPS